MSNSILRFIDIFNTREKAIAVWIVLALIFILAKKNIRELFSEMFKLLFSKKILLVNTITLLYVSIVILLLYRIHLWNFGLLKDSIYWVTGTAIVLLFNIIDANKEKQFFKKITLDSVKLMIIIEFIVNFYTFNFWIELLLVPIFFLIGGLIAISETEKKYQQVNNFLNSVTSIIGIYFLVYFFFKLATDYHTFINLDSFHVLIHPPILTITFIPFLYLFALFMAYETLFLRLGFFVKDRTLLKFIKHQIFRVCNLNLSKINKFSKNNANQLNQVTDKSMAISIISNFKNNDQKKVVL